uniref:Uncharacterized protein n=1 Tax=Arundo donax TaxID=35708 RepID=A0A0A9AYL9_ARUDO
MLLPISTRLHPASFLPPSLFISSFIFRASRHLFFVAYRFLMIM